MSAHLAPGVWGVLATPFRGSGLAVDTQGLAQLAQHTERSGAAGLTVLGVFGEAAALSWQERRQVLETVLAATDLPVVVGCTGLSTAPVVDEARMALDVAGERLAAVMVQANSPTARVLSDHLHAVHDQAHTNIVLQDYPLVSGVKVTTDQIAEVADQSPFLAAVKAESPPTAVALGELTARTEVPVFGGLGGVNLLDELACGAAGAMTGFSYPEVLVATVAAWQRGGHAAARAQLLQHLPLITFEQQAGIALAIRKECLRQRGLIAESRVRPPSRTLPESLARPLAAHLQSLQEN